jgi:ribosome-associated protein
MAASMLVVEPNIRIPLREFQFTFVRSGGPGGQNVNKTATKAVLRWNVVGSGSLDERTKSRFLELFRRRISSEGDLVLSSQRFRDQGRNTADCLEKLRDMLRQAAHRPKTRKPTKPSRGSVQDRLAAKRKKSQQKQSRRPPRVDD